jgi:hypothetical protein
MAAYDENGEQPCRICGYGPGSHGSVAAPRRPQQPARRDPLPPLPDPFEDYQSEKGEY